MEDKQAKVKHNRAQKRKKTQFFNLKAMVEQLKAEGAIQLPVLKGIITQASAMLQNEPSLLKLKSPLIIVGDIHGQFYDLLNVIEKFGHPAKTRYLFLGDYVDRGKFCIEVITYVLTLKIAYPQNIYLMRGNHQGRAMTSYFNFKQECQAKYNNDVYELFLDLFTKLPLAAIIDHKYFAVHGGISPFLRTTGQIDKLNRFVQIPDTGTICDMLWSDPIDENHQNWLNNKMRSCSYYYSRNQTMKFLNSNKLSLIIRGHQVQMKGFKYQNGVDNQALTLTIFSAPRYCDTHKNKGGVCLLSSRGVQIRTFSQVEHPYVPPNYLNAFQLTFPKVASGVTKIFAFLLKYSKIRQSILNVGSNQLSQLMQTMQNVNNLEQYLQKNVNVISNLLNGKSDSHAQISQNVSDFEEKENQIINQISMMPLIFGPKTNFVRVLAKKEDATEDEEPQTECFD